VITSAEGTIGFLHTADEHVALFGELVEDLAPRARALHRVCPRLLAEARAHGIDEALRDGLLGELRLLIPRTDAVVCTCSTLGAVAERLGARLSTPVLRVDRPMAEKVASHGGSVAVVASLESTLQPTCELLEECGVTDLRPAPCLEAWELLEAGDCAGYTARLACHVRELADEVDVVVLAQASMIGVEALVEDIDAMVCSSPRLAVAAVAGLMSRPRKPPVAGWRM
jgi:hypothetical protein